jgi:hypothetical protein
LGGAAARPYQGRSNFIVRRTANLNGIRNCPQITRISADTENALEQEQGEITKFGSSTISVA